MDETRDIPDRKSTLAEQGKEDDLRHLSQRERIAMVWPLTVSAWAMKGENVAGRTLQRHVECVRRGRR